MNDIVERIREVFSDTPKIIDMCAVAVCWSEGQEIASHIQGLYDAALEAADEIERLLLLKADWRAFAMTENHDLWRENERLRAELLKISELEPEGPLGSDCMAVSYASETARAALEGRLR